MAEIAKAMRRDLTEIRDLTLEDCWLELQEATAIIGVSVIDALLETEMWQEATRPLRNSS
jgi:hypothetical protein